MQKTTNIHNDNYLWTFMGAATGFIGGLSYQLIINTPIKLTLENLTKIFDNTTGLTIIGAGIGFLQSEE